MRRYLQFSQLPALLVLICLYHSSYAASSYQHRANVHSYNKTHMQLSTDMSFPPVKSAELKQLVYRIADSLKYYYVSVKEGIETGDYIKQQFKKGKYNKIKDPKKLAKELTKDLRSVHNDLHLFVSHREGTSPSNPSNDTAPTNIFNGLSEIKFFDETMYVKFSDFGNWSNASHARQTISRLTPLFQGKKALIIDVRDNLGGVPFVVSHLLSYFFEESPKKLADYYIRYNDTRYGIFTEPNVPGMRYPKLPIYVLVNGKTASAGEELAFWLQGQKRATIIGQNTIGAGYGAMEHRLNKRFFISISNETEVDPITKKGFQITGVKPDVIMDAKLSLDKALALANKQSRSNDDLSMGSLKARIDALDVNAIDETISSLISTYHNTGLLNHTSINRLGYEYMSTPQKARAILKMNTLLYPFYPNSFDSYADALTANNEYELAKKNYQKAVTLARLKNNRSLPQFENNEAAFLKKYEKHLQSKKAITETLQKYINGSTGGKPNLLKEAFHPDLNLYYVRNNQVRTWSGDAYITDTKEGQPTGESGRVLSIDYTNDIAVAKVEISNPKMKTPYIDYFLLLKTGGNWVIVHKAFTKKIN